MKQYVKPDVFYEDFELSMGVASCGLIVFDKNGNLKSYNKNDAGIIAMEAVGVFGNSCSIPLTSDNVYYYYGSAIGEIFGS